MAPESMGALIPGSWSLRDCAAALALAQVASGLVDLDLRLLPPHRKRSPFHWPEVPLVCLIFAWLLWRWGSRWGFGAFYAALGWAAHLAGDILQGGLWSPLCRRMVGFRSLGGGSYQRWGPLVDGVVHFLAFWAALDLSIRLGFPGTIWDLALYPPALWALFSLFRSSRELAALAVGAALTGAWILKGLL